MLILSLPAYKKYIRVAKKSSLVMVDSRVLTRLKPEEVRKDVERVAVPAADLAEKLGNPIVANMVILAAYTKKTRIIALDQLRDAVKTIMRPQFHDLNLKAIEVGAQSV